MPDRASPHSRHLLSRTLKAEPVDDQTETHNFIAATRDTGLSAAGPGDDSARIAEKAFTQVPQVTHVRAHDDRVAPGLPSTYRFRTVNLSSTRVRASSAVENSQRDPGSQFSGLDGGAISIAVTFAAGESMVVAVSVAGLGGAAPQPHQPDSIVNGDPKEELDTAGIPGAIGMS